MTIPNKTKAPPLADAVRPESLGAEARFAEVCLPSALPSTLSYLVLPEHSGSIGPGSVVWAPLRGVRRLGMVLAVHTNTPTFAVYPCQPHESAYRFAEPYLEMIDWLGRYYYGGACRALDVCWPSQLAKYLSHADLNKSELGSFSAIEGPTLTGEQQYALSTLQGMLPLADSTGFRGALLHGVTGSGKTQVYIELVRQCLQLGRNAIILVPEIGLTPQTHARFQDQLNVKVHLLHSNLPAPQHRQTWHALLRGEVKVLLGTRSALLAPNMQPGLIIIDEEHDGSYKQHDPAPRYHCRELAYHIGHKQNALVVLGSATPSLETWENAQRGNLSIVQLKKRARPVPLPQVQIIDMKEQATLQDRDWMLSSTLREALQHTIDQGKQAIVLHNRRGYSTSRICLDCGATRQCQDCQVPLVYHKQHNSLVCHYCSRLYPIDISCAECGSKNHRLVGGAIEKAEQEILEWIPTAKVLRLDRDTSARKGGFEAMLQAFRGREYDILLGTQMVAKGHDFPDVQLVGVIGADSGASLPDFRAGERTFQLLSQVAGRAGRATAGGIVMLQTWSPDDQVMAYALRHDYQGFAAWESAHRRLLGYPPFMRLLSIGFSSRHMEKAENCANQLAQLLADKKSIQCLGPAEPMVARVAGMHRRHMLLKGETAHVLRQALDDALSQLPDSFKRGVEIRVDVDPIDII